MGDVQWYESGGAESALLIRYIIVADGDKATLSFTARRGPPSIFLRIRLRFVLDLVAAGQI